MFVLTAMAVDLSAAFLAQRELHDATAAAAADATAALARGAFYDGNTVALDADVAGNLARARMVSSLDLRRHSDLEVSVSVVGPQRPTCPPTVVVAAASSVSHIFGAALPGGSGGIRVTARSAARPQQSATPDGC